MKKIHIKTKINQLIQKLGSKQAVADKLGLSLRQIYYYSTGEKKATISEAKHIDLLLKERK